MPNQDAKNRAISQAKTDFIGECIQVARTLEEVFLKSSKLLVFYQDNNYVTDLTIEDLEPYRFSKDELTDFVELMHQILLMAKGDSVTPAQYQRINNQIK